MSDHKPMKINLKIWRQKSCKDQGHFENYEADQVLGDMQGGNGDPAV